MKLGPVSAALGSRPRDAGAPGSWQGLPAPEVCAGPERCPAATCWRARAGAAMWRGGARHHAVGVSLLCVALARGVLSGGPPGGAAAESPPAGNSTGTQGAGHESVDCGSAVDGAMGK